MSWVKVSSGQHTHGNVLLFTTISRDEAGEYVCEAANECGNVSTAASIDVLCK